MKVKRNENVTVDFSQLSHTSDRNKIERFSLPKVIVSKEIVLVDKNLTK